jgi:hypothetical protein
VKGNNMRNWQLDDDESDDHYEDHRDDQDDGCEEPIEDDLYFYQLAKDSGVL